MGKYTVYAYDAEGNEWAYMYETASAETAQRWADSFAQQWVNGKDVDWAFWDMATSAEDM